MKKIGLVNIDTSHPFSWAQKMAEHPELDMQYTMLFSDGFRGDDEVNWFVDKYNMEGRAASIEELAEKCDVGFVQSCNWEKLYSYHPMGSESFAAPENGIYELSEKFFETAGGIYRDSEYYSKIVK